MQAVNFLNNYNRLVSIAEEWLCAEPLAAKSSTVLEDACRYSLGGGGKRLRPVLVLSAAELVDVPFEKIKGYTLAVEYIHTFSLIHDDLPQVDNDAIRRGRPTCHLQFGEAVALLAGDCLMGKAFAAISGDKSLEAAAAVELTALLSKAMVELCDGQMMDLEAAKNCCAEQKTPAGAKTSEELLRERHLKKTGALIRASLLGPVACMPVPEAQEEARKQLEIYGTNLGLLFQITDDILDVTSTSAVLGKTVRADEKHGTPTYVTVYGIDKALKLAMCAADAANEALLLFGKKADFLHCLCRWVLERKR
jgi:geranylgeranyl pyrophosphate synthase